MTSMLKENFVDLMKGGQVEKTGNLFMLFNPLLNLKIVVK